MYENLFIYPNCFSTIYGKARESKSDIEFFWIWWKVAHDVDWVKSGEADGSIFLFIFPINEHVLMMGFESMV